MKILDETLKLLRSEQKLKITSVKCRNLTDECAFLSDATFLFESMENYDEFKEDLKIARSM